MRAGEWLLHSGIQAPNGGVARYYRSDLGQNLPLSTEITGYAISGLLYLYEQDGDPACQRAAVAAGRFLIDQAWDADSKTFPFEVEGTQRFSFFFDCGIIARALLWLYRSSGQEEFLEYARLTGLAMERDFRGLSGFHPIVKLPCKSPVPYEIWWSKMPGAFQLKSALAWRDLGETLGEERFVSLYEEQLVLSLRRFAETLDNEQHRPKLMDRLHAWSYFLEGLQPVKSRPEVRSVLVAALERGEALLEELEPQFVRSDVCAQLLRVRLLEGGWASAKQLHRIESFQMESADRRLEGGFSFGRREGELAPHANPVSTVFCLQALGYARLAAAGELEAHADWRKLI
jgi:hypothetical protein